MVHKVCSRTWTHRHDVRNIGMHNYFTNAQWKLYVPHSGHYMYRTVVTICTAQWSLYIPHNGHYIYGTAVTVCKLVLAFNNATFCPQSVFVCSVWISEQTAIISLYNINWLVCITETECVYCAVRTGYINIIQVICFIWIWEQTATISLYSIKWLVFITKTGCVYCAVRTGCFLNHTIIEARGICWNFWYFVKYRNWSFVLGLKIENSFLRVSAFRIINLPDHNLCQGKELLEIKE